MSFKSNYNGALRRFALTPPTWETLQGTLRHLYGAPAYASVAVQYKDEDGDDIFISSDMELEEAIRIAAKKAVLPINIEFNPAVENIPSSASSTPVSTPRSETPRVEIPRFRVPVSAPAPAAFDLYSRTPMVVENAVADAVSQVSAVLSQFPGPLADSLSKTIAELGPMVQNMANSGNASTASSSGATATAGAAGASKGAVHGGVTCDNCNTVPISGIRYKCVVCHNFDLCSDCEKKGVHNPTHPLLKITSPIDGFSVDCFVDNGNMSPKRKCCGERPGSPKRNRNEGDQTSETDSQNTNDDSKSVPEVAIHLGIACSKCNVHPIVGTRFQCESCPDYDLCAGCEITKDAFHDPTHVFRVHLTPVYRPPWARCFQGGRGGRGAHHHSRFPTPAHAFGGPIPPPFGPHGPFGPHWPFGQHGPFGWKGMKGCRKPWKMDGACKKWFDKCERKMEDKNFLARFVRNITIEDGTEVLPGVEFVKIWRFRNEGGEPWPSTAHLLAVGGDNLATVNAVPVKMTVEPGQEVDVAVPMRASDRPGRYVQYFRLGVGPEESSHRFGQRVWINVEVIDPANADDVPEALRNIPTSSSAPFGGKVDVVTPMDVVSPSAPPVPSPAPAPTTAQPSSNAVSATGYVFVAAPDAEAPKNLNCEKTAIEESKNTNQQTGQAAVEEVRTKLAQMEVEEQPAFDVPAPSVVTTNVNVNVTTSVAAVDPDWVALDRPQVNPTVGPIDPKFKPVFDLIAEVAGFTDKDEILRLMQAYGGRVEEVLNSILDGQ